MDDALKERFLQLPAVVRDAIVSSEVDQHLRDLAGTHQLHLDQWELLQHEVMMTLLGVEQVEDLPVNLEKHVGVRPETAAELAKAIGQIIFDPIRAELEKDLPEPVGNAGAASAAPAQTSAPAVVPATPPSSLPSTTVIRAPTPEAYKQGEASTVRTVAGGDPYREPAT